MTICISNNVKGTSHNNKKRNIAFGSFESLITRKADSMIISSDFFKTINKLKKKYSNNKFFDVLVFRDGKVVCGQIELNHAFQGRNHLDCDPQFLYENSSGTGAKLYTKISDRVKLMNKKYKSQIKSDSILRA